MEQRAMTAVLTVNTCRSDKPLQRETQMYDIPTTHAGQRQKVNFRLEVLYPHRPSTAPLRLTG